MARTWALAAGLAAATLPGIARARPGPPLACPPGTTRQKLFYADEFWCARPDGTKHGPYRNLNDPSREEGGYREGKRHGWWRRWQNGVVVDERRYDRDRADGLARTWSPEGVLLSSGALSRGKEVGLWRWWHENGRLRQSGRYAHGKEVGAWRSWHRNGRRHEIDRYQGGQPEGRHSEWDEDGQLIEAGGYHNGVRSGLWIVSQDEKLAGRGRYLRARREGRWVFTFEGKRTAVGNYRRGRREGAWTLYDLDGKRVQARGRYHRGHREGTWIVRDEREVAIARCWMGTPHGRLIWRRLWEGGAGLAEHEIVAHYRYGRLDGWWTDHSPPGSRGPPVERGLYRSGELVRGDAFDVAEVLWMPDGYSAHEFCEAGQFDDIKVFDDP